MNKQYISIIISTLWACHHARAQTNTPPSQPAREQAEMSQPQLDQETKSAFLELYKSMIISTNRHFFGFVEEGLNKQKILVVPPEDYYSPKQLCTLPEIKEIIDTAWGTNSVSVKYPSDPPKHKPDDVLLVKVSVFDVTQKQGAKIMEGTVRMHYALCRGQSVSFELILENGKWKVRALDVTGVE